MVGTTEDHQIVGNDPVNDQSGDVFAADRYLKDDTDDGFAADRYLKDDTDDGFAADRYLKDDTDDGFATDKRSSGDYMAKRSYLPALLQAAR